MICEEVGGVQQDKKSTIIQWNGESLLKRQKQCLLILDFEKNSTSYFPGKPTAKSIYHDYFTY